MVQALLPPHLPKIDTESRSPEILPALPTPSSIRAIAFVTLGKLSLRDAELAKSSVNLFARELHQNYNYTESAFTGEDSVAVRSNALVVLGDLCVKYTNLVDSQLPTMAACLQDGCGSNDKSCATVRRHAIHLLSSLLLQDYVKWRGLLVHRFLAATVDKDASVGRLAEMTLSGPLLSKNTNLFSKSFVNAIFVFNHCTKHPIYAAAATCGDNGSAGAVNFSGVRLDGASNKRKRMKIYSFMLSHMTDEQRIEATARLAKEVLGGALRGGKLAGATRAGTDDEESMAVLSDCFSVLTCPEIKVGKTARDDEIDGDETSAPCSVGVGVGVGIGGPATAQLAAAKGKLLTKISSKHMVQVRWQERQGRARSFATFGGGGPQSDLFS